MGTKADLLDATSVRHAYRRWAPVYDFTFGPVAEAGRKHAVQIINRRKGRVLEVGVGTGLSLPCYGKHLTITGIDLSPEMLARRKTRVERKRLSNVAGLHEMDAGALAFPDESFDTVVAMYVMTVVPDPEKVMRELERVCATGRRGHPRQPFQPGGGLARLARAAGSRRSPTSIGWHAGVRRSIACSSARICGLPSGGRSGPSGLFTMLRFVKEPGFGLVPQAYPAGTVRRGQGAAADQARLPEPIRVRIKWQVARSRVVGRRLLDTRYWRSLYRRLSSQMAE